MLKQDVLQNNSLLKHALNLVNEESNTFDVYDPYDHQMIGKVKSYTDKEVELAIQKCQDAMNEWRRRPLVERSRLLYEWYRIIVEYTDELAEIITLENGKVLADAKREIVYGANFVEWFAGEARSLHGIFTSGNNANQRIAITYEPVGVVAAITPWNFPNAMITRKIAPAIAAGCGILLKPSEYTPFSALALQYLAEKAGFPQDLIQVITGDASVIGDVFMDSYTIRKFTFTGSTSVGKKLYTSATKTIKKVSLELGGNAPFIIFDDVNQEATATDLINAKMRSTSQACTSPNRIFIHEKIYDSMLSILVGKFEKLKVGSGFDATNDLGTLINDKAIDKVMNLVKDAESKGARVLCGGSTLNEAFVGKNCLLPTVIAGCTEAMSIFSEEIFAPVLAIYKFSSYDEVIRLANKTQYGLASYAYTQNNELIWKLSQDLDYGIVGINNSIISNEIGAFAGRKDSGIGVEGSKLGIYEFLNTKYICMQ